MLVVYVTGHGFGHAVRVSEVVRVLRQMAPGLPVEVRGRLPVWIFPSDGVRTVSVEADVGLAQLDGLTIDYEESLRRLEVFEASWEGRVHSEAEALRKSGARVVLGDIPPLGFAAAAEAGLPAFALANFSWDWIYGSLAERTPAFARHAARAAEAYSRATALLRLPFHGDMPAFPSVHDVPLVAPRSALSRDEARRRLDLPADVPVVVLSFGGFGFGGFPAARLADLGDMLFVATERYGGAPPNVVTLDPARLDYPMLLRAADAVVTKPGYGIVSSALVAGVRVLYTARGEFPEFPLLAGALERHGTARFVPLEVVRAGEIGEPLRDLLARPTREAAIASDGAERVAAILGEALGLAA